MNLTMKLAAALLIFRGVVFFVPSVRLGGLVLVGRGRGCPLSEALKCPANLERQGALKDQIVRDSKLVQKDGAFHLWNTPRGQYWIPRGSDWALPWDLAEQARHIYGTGDRAVRAGDIVLDCGANVGVYVREALKAGARTVVAIEVAPENVECLRRNFADEIGHGRVIVYPKGVWDKDDFLTLNVDPENSAADSLVMRPKESHQGPRVPLTTIDNLVGELKLERVDYIKMDIEGAEQKALTGAQATLKRFHPRMALSAYHVADDPWRIPELVRKAWPGYHIECGPCADATTFVRPDVLYFY